MMVDDADADAAESSEEDTIMHTAKKKSVRCAVSRC